MDTHVWGKWYDMPISTGIHAGKGHLYRECACGAMQFKDGESGEVVSRDSSHPTGLECGEVRNG